MPSQSTESKQMLKTGKGSICNNTSEEKASIMAVNIWFHEGLYKLSGEGKKQLRKKYRTACRKLSNCKSRAPETRSTRTHDSALYYGRSQKRKTPLKSHSEEDNHSNIYTL